MSIVRPFRAIRPGEGYAEQIISLPYDVMNRKEAAQMAEGKPHSFLHICRAEIDLPEQNNPYDISVYEKAKSNIAENLEQGVFVYLSADNGRKRPDRYCCMCFSR